MKKPPHRPRVVVQKHYVRVHVLLPSSGRCYFTGVNHGIAGGVLNVGRQYVPIKYIIAVEAADGSRLQ